jgi:hypothetical protein
VAIDDGTMPLVSFGLKRTPFSKLLSPKQSLDHMEVLGSTVRGLTCKAPKALNRILRVRILAWGFFVERELCLEFDSEV